MANTILTQEDDWSAEISSIVNQLNAICERVSPILESESCPFVTLTYAQAIDGSIAAGRGGAPLRLSSEGSMKMTHHLRAWHDGILVGIGTVISDNPSLNTRLCEGPSPRPIVLDSDLRCPPQAKFIQLRKAAGLSSPIIVCSTNKRLKCADPTEDLQRSARKQLLEAAGVTVLESRGGDWKSMLIELRKNFGLERIMIEGGAKVIRSALVEAHLFVHSLIVTIAPLYVGGLVPTLPWDATRSATRVRVKANVTIQGDIVFCAELDNSSA